MQSAQQQQLGGLLQVGRQTEVLDAATVAALLAQGGNGGAGLPQGLHLGGLGSLSALPPQQQAGQQQQLNLSDLALLSQFGTNAVFSQPGVPAAYGAADLQQHLAGQAHGVRGLGGGKTRSSDSRTSSAYASRHQAAEQRRRTRINERLELLRKMVPHAERANTACFLEEVIKYIDSLKRRNLELESALGSGKPVKMSSHGAPGSQMQPSGSGASGAGGANGMDSHLDQAQAQQQQAGQQAPSLPPQQQQQQQQPGLHQQVGVGQASQLSGLSMSQHRLLGGHAGLQASQLPLSGHSLGAFNVSALTHFNALQPQSMQQAQGGAAGQAAKPLGLHGGPQAPQHHTLGHHALLSDLHTVQVVPGLPTLGHSHGMFQQPGSNNKTFLTFNEDLYNLAKQDVLRSLGQASAAGPATPSTSLQLTTVPMPADSMTATLATTNTNNAMGEPRKTQSGASPVSSEESGVPLKKRKVLLL